MFDVLNIYCNDFQLKTFGVKKLPNASYAVTGLSAVAGGTRIAPNHL